MARGVIPGPYVYPTAPHVRRHGPRGWKDYQRYRPWLRDEFSFRCVYCLDREVWRDMREQMHIDHFVPQAIRNDLKGEYANLLYACPACNCQKSDTLLFDPCKVALGNCLQIHEDGRIEAKNKHPEGQALIDELALNHPRTIHRRRIMIGMLRTMAEFNWPIFVEWMGYPKDLPDLNGRGNKPPHNDKPGGIAQSCFEKKKRSDLPEIY
jgi:hypothetical protein